FARPERKTITPAEQRCCFLTRTHPEQTLPIKHRYKVCDSVLKDLKNSLHCGTALGRSAMADKRAQIDRFSSHRWVKIERSQITFFFKLCGRVHEGLSNRF